MDNEEPDYMPYKLLRKITDGFSDKRVVGRGTFGVVYKGEDEDAKVIAVKILKYFPGVNDGDFHTEFNNLSKLRHENIVQLLGFCNETEPVVVEHNGEQVCAVEVHRALCFEFVQNGSLDKHLHDVDCGFGWNRRYGIIKGICEGLRYLHMRSRPVYHLDLKPDNILLDDNMVPKLADFGLSRLLGEETTKATMSAVGTSGYLPPEYINYQIISKEFDIFSLGVIVIKIMMGSAGYSLISDMEPGKFIEHVCNKWRGRLQVIGWQIRQVKKCIEIALKCIENDKNCRPTIGSIIEQLNETERHTNYSASSMEEIMDYEVPSSMYDVLERLLHDQIAEPRELPLPLLRAITDDFADHQIIHVGECSVVYKGVLLSGKVVAVKKLSVRFGYDFHKCLKHKSIVRLLGYCGEGSLLCFEYPSGGILDAYITDPSQGLSWRKRYKIIKGICEGYYYLRENHTVHLDLKPGNIWLDKKKAPKIHVSIFDERYMGTIGYMAPEFKANRPDTWSRVDIYSLGVLITEILTGHIEISSLNKAVKGWTQRLLGTSRGETHFEQILVCADIVRSCLEEDRDKRPHIEHIIEMLVERESTDELAEQDEMESEDEFTPDKQTMELNILERVVAGSNAPSHIDLSLLQSITENFSEKRRIGGGGCGKVYKGILRNGIVAVKRLHNSRTIEDKMFQQEVQIWITVRHENIVQFLGYCFFTEEREFTFEGRTVMAELRERLLCFEYISNGNLEDHLTDELRGLEWHIRYEIIVGICSGLLYLHEEKDIIHMDIKPANIMLDDHMVPKITDFGLSRFYSNSHTKTPDYLISLGYCAPEYISQGKSSRKSDIYSLGVMIRELVTGTRKEPDPRKVLRRWMHRWIKSLMHTPLGYQQVKKCLELAQRCMQIDPTSRPDIVDITHELSTIDSKGGQFQEIPCLDDMLGIEPLEIHFPFEIDLQISHSIELTNDTDDYIAFMMTAQLCCFHIEPDKGIVSPRSKCSVAIKMQAQVPKMSHNFHNKIIVQSTIVDGSLATMDITGDVFIEKGSTVVDEVNVMVVFDKPPLAEES